MTTLPGIWRGFQCVRRYWDTGNKFPHLLNCGKYLATVVSYITLSAYRIDKNTATHAAFITFAIVNSVYTSFWDIYYDWSLGDLRANHPFLRKELGYKKVWWYYAAIIVDPILRFNWVLYTIMPLQLQHSAVTSFAISLSEICRRGMWSLFRVENEHCTNVGRFRASRDVPLPYSVSSGRESAPRGGRRRKVDVEQPSQTRTPSTRSTFLSATSAEPRRSRSSMRHRRPMPVGNRPSYLNRALTHVGDIFRGAHAQDFERKRKPELGRDPRNTKMEEDETDEDTDGEEREVESGNESNEDDIIYSDDDAQDDEGEGTLSQIREDMEIGMSGGRGE